jgi:bis(5'-adenosyl)-triphosphatase
MKDQSIPLITCPFCSPDNQGIAFASSRSFLALYNIAPILPGHTLIIPRMHIKSLRFLSDELISEFFQFSRKVTEILLKYYKADAFDWSLQDNEAAGQTVQHLHLHIIVRHPSDLPEPGDWYPLLESQNKNESNKRPDLGKEEYTRIAESLRTAYNEANKASSDSYKK